MARITQETRSRIANSVFRRHAQVHLDTEREYCAAVEDTGVPVAKVCRDEEIESIKQRLGKRGCVVRNNGTSLVIHGLSPACEACTTGADTASFYISLQCSRNCYFCFNPNQDSYVEHCAEKRDWKRELDSALVHGVDMKCIGLTGGEPLLFRQDTLDFFAYARKLYPQAHLRLYTSGDFLDEALCADLCAAGLDEIRFSVKMGDSDEAKESLFEKIAFAKRHISVVMVEMPVEPGTFESMQRLLLRLDSLKVNAINLLELCYPFHNASAFRERGFEVRNPPLRTYYNYWYAGGVPIDSSELDCLRLVEFAMDAKLDMGVHYCSLANKHSAQLYEQNAQYQDSSGVYEFDRKDFFLKTVKAYGDDVKLVQEQLDAMGLPYVIDEGQECVLMHPSSAERLGVDIELGLSYSVAEKGPKGWIVREVRLDTFEKNLDH